MPLAAAPAATAVARILALDEELFVGHRYTLRMEAARVFDVGVVVGHPDDEARGLHGVPPEAAHGLPQAHAGRLHCVPRRFRAGVGDVHARTESIDTYGVSWAVGVALRRAFSAVRMPNTTTMTTITMNTPASVALT